MRRFAYSVFGVLVLTAQSGRCYSQIKPANCVQSHGFHFFSDAILGAIGACNCQKAPVYISEFRDCETDSYEIEFEDDFDGDSLDLTKWMPCPWTRGALDGAQHFGASRLENVTLKNGICYASVRMKTLMERAVPYDPDDKLAADGRPNLRAYDHTYSLIFTRKTYLYGKYEIRCRMPEGAGLWPAFWMYGGIRGNEIDFFDSYAGTDTYVTSIGHDFDDTKKNHGCSSRQKGIDLREWHTFTSTFDHDKIKFFIDGELRRVIHRVETITGKFIECGEEVEPGNYYQIKAYPVEPMYLIFGMGLISRNGPAGSSPVDASTPFPSSLEVDYIRHWKRRPYEINIFPNPSKEKLTIKSTGAQITSISIYTMDGIKVLTQSESSSQAEINVASLRDGFYVLQIEYNGMTECKKIAVIR